MTQAARAAELLAGFPGALRVAGLPVDPARASDFLRATTRCRLHGLDDLARVGRVTLTGSHDEFAIYDEVFAVWFGDGGRVATAEPEVPAAAPARDRPAGEALVLPDPLRGAAAGRAATADEVVGRKRFRPAADDERRAMSRLRRRLDLLPDTVRRRWVTAPAGRRIDVAGTARAARRSFGETLRLMRQAREVRPRRLLLLVDVSGSMKAHSELTLRFAQLLTRSRPRVETFTFGTRLTRVSSVLARRDGEAALASLAERVFDFDGGTRIGPALEAFLTVRTNSALARGAVIVVFSDGLERGDPAAMIAAVGRLARLGHRLVWVTPLAADPDYRPVTRGMAGVLPALDAVCDGSGPAALERLPGRVAAAERGPRGAARRQFREGPT